MFNGFDVSAKLQEELSILLLDAEFLDVELTEPVEQVQCLQCGLHSTDARLHERLQVGLSRQKLLVGNKFSAQQQQQQQRQRRRRRQQQLNGITLPVRRRVVRIYMTSYRLSIVTFALGRTV